MGVQALCRMLYGVLTLATLLLYSRYFFDNYTAALGGLGQVVVVGSFGAVAAAFVTPYATRRIGGRVWIIALTALVAVDLPTLALPFIPVLLVAATFLMNVSSQGMKIVVDTNVQVHCDENFRGRVFSVEDTLFNMFFVLGLFIGATTLPDNGHSVSTIVAISAGYSWSPRSTRWPPADRRGWRSSRSRNRGGCAAALSRQPAATARTRRWYRSRRTPRQSWRSARPASPSAGSASQTC